jgi:hypothetical protein
MFKKIVLGVLGLFIASAALTVVLPRSGEAQIGSTPVRVVNTPLPIAGNVNATVSGNVGLAPGTTVGVAGPVTIDNSAGPVVVRDGPPVMLVARIDMTEGEDYKLGSVYLYGPDMDGVLSLPFGKRLVLEYINLLVRLPEGQRPWTILGTAFGGYSQDIFLQLSPESGSGDYQVAYDQVVRAYVDGGMQLRAQRKGGSSGTALFVFRGSGHLVDKNF